MLRATELAPRRGIQTSNLDNARCGILHAVCVDAYRKGQTMIEPVVLGIISLAIIVLVILFLESW